MSGVLHALRAAGGPAVGASVSGVLRVDGETVEGFELDRVNGTGDVTFEVTLPDKVRLSL